MPTQPQHVPSRIEPDHNPCELRDESVIQHRNLTTAATMPRVAEAYDLALAPAKSGPRIKTGQSDDDFLLLRANCFEAHQLVG